MASAFSTREMSLLSRVRFAGVGLLTILALSGCGSSTDGKVTGYVTMSLTYEGQPITAGAVQLVVPNSEKGAFGQLDESGTVTFENVEVGNYTVTVFPPAPSDPDPENPAPPQSYDNIPVEYRSQATSSLKADVKEGSNEFRFELTSGS